MDYKQATAILVELIKKDSLTPEEKEAVKTALGILSWAVLSKGNIDSLKKKRDKDSKW